jgi:2-keto-4-pentenoate hydratase/2-oxohepta-3-ene-1,7-dioic acid hydratase in catechol pathway
MRLVTYANGGQTGVGVEADGGVFYTGYVDMIELIRDGDRGLERAAAAAKSGLPVADVCRADPATRKIFGSGVNYRSHGDEEPLRLPDEPCIDFTRSRAPSSPGPISWIRRMTGSSSGPGASTSTMRSFGVVFSAPLRNVSQERALDLFSAITLFNDAARAVQFQNKQADLGKGFDTLADGALHRTDRS